MASTVKRRHAGIPRCSTPTCHNPRARRGNGFRSVCHKCRAQAFRLRNPVTAAYHNLKHRAKERGKVFLITPEEFEAWCIKTNYIELKGKSAKAMTIDRREETGPYSIDNIEMRTSRENIQKYHRYAGHKTATPVPETVPPDDNPF